MKKTMQRPFLLSTMVTTDEATNGLVKIRLTETPEDKIIFIGQVRRKNEILYGFIFEYSIESGEFSVASKSSVLEEGDEISIVGTYIK